MSISHCFIRTENTSSQPAVLTLKEAAGIWNVLHADLLTAFKIFTGSLELPASLFLHQPSRTGLNGHTFKVALPQFAWQRHLCGTACLRRITLRFSIGSLRKIGPPEMFTFYHPSPKAKTMNGNIRFLFIQFTESLSLLSFLE